MWQSTISPPIGIPDSEDRKFGSDEKEPAKATVGKGFALASLCTPFVGGNKDKVHCIKDKTVSDAEKELLDLTRKLLQSIALADWETYTVLCDPSLTAFEPEALGQRVEGLDFHRFYFDLAKSSTKSQATLCQPHVRLLGDTGIVTYVRLTQVSPAGAPPATAAYEETRVWHKTSAGWKHVHFHRSPAASAG